MKEDRFFKDTAPWEQEFHEGYRLALFLSGFLLSRGL
jgi:hypothetical protein